VYIPPIPPKKNKANKDEKYLKERRIFLEKFIRMLGENEFLIHSDEFKIFSRNQGSIDKTLKLLTKMTPKVLLDKYASNFKYEVDPDSSITKSSITDINEFCSFIKKASAMLKDLKERAFEMLRTMEALNSNYKNMAKMLTKYEDHNLNHYCEGLHTR
jgi:hypothetical protein